jgi:hypothetical protein
LGGDETRCGSLPRRLNLRGLDRIAAHNGSPLALFSTTSFLYLIYLLSN